jgi:hypothetical protein
VGITLFASGTFASLIIGELVKELKPNPVKILKKNKTSKGYLSLVNSILFIENPLFIK